MLIVFANGMDHNHFVARRQNIWFGGMITKIVLHVLLTRRLSNVVRIPFGALGDLDRPLHSLQFHVSQVRAGCDLPTRAPTGSTWEW